MEPTTHEQDSFWRSTVELPHGEPLAKDLAVDVCIVGAGIAGLSTAYLLTRAGRSVAILDHNVPGGGMTQSTSAHLSNAIDDRYTEIERMHGSEGARLAARSHTAAIDEIERIVRHEQLDCDFQRVDGYLFCPPGEAEEILDRELDAALRAGIDVMRAARAPFPAFDTGPCLRFANQGQFHPLKYLIGLTAALQREGARLFPFTRADRIEGGARAQVFAGAHVVRAGSIVVATNNPINDLVAIHTKQRAYMTYVIAAAIPRDSVPLALYWDTADPYHYVRVQPGGAGAGRDLLIVGGEDYRTGQEQDSEQRYERLERWARERAPLMEEIAFRWGGQVMETIDGLAFIGRNPLDEDNVYVMTGDSGMGLTHGTLGAMLITDMILGRENPWQRLYDPSRKTLRAAGTFAQEALNTVAQYTDWVTGGDVSSVDEIAGGDGAILREGLSKVAVYRDDLGVLHRFSAVCPHLGCIVQWNPTEKTWDCPCHGSRFDREGKVMVGPANRDLDKC